MRDLLRLDAASRPAMWLVIGRAVGLGTAFVVPLVLVRLFDQTAFGTYKQLFLIYTTLYGLAQLGVAESLYYFVPRRPSEAGRHVANAAITLAVVGVACIALLGLAAGRIAEWFSNPHLGDTLVLLGIFLALMLATAPFEIVMVSRTRYKTAAITYAASDILRGALMLLLAMVIGGLQGVLWGAIAFAAMRLIAMLWLLRRDFGPDLRPTAILWRHQWIYTLPFALAVGMEVVQANVHQYVVAARFDPATFAIYAVGCLQIPLVDVIATSSANVMMVKMGEADFDKRGAAALALWHNTMSRLALVIVPLAVFLVVMAKDIIVVLFTSSYLASVPIFRLWTLTIVFAIPCVDAVLRANAQTRFLLGLNVLRLAVVIGLISWFLTHYGLAGAVLVTLLSTALVRIIGLARIARLFGLGFATVLPWKELARTALYATLAAIPAYWVAEITPLPRLLVLLCAAAVYAVTYFALCFGIAFRISPFAFRTSRVANAELRTANSE